MNLRESLVQLRRFRPWGNKPLVWLAVATILLVTLVGLWFFQRVFSTLSQERQHLQSVRRVIVETKLLSPTDRAGIEFYGYSQEIRAVKRFAGAYYAATSGGLVVFDNQGQVTTHHTTMGGLPENDLTDLEVFQERLYLGTATQGLISFDGQRFVQHRFLQPRAQHVSDLEAMGSTLIVGLFDDGLFEYDGNQFRRISSTPSELKQVTAILARFPIIWAGTFSRGLFVWREGRWDHFTTDQGLPSNRITDILDDSDGVLIGTDLGIARLKDNGAMAPVAALANVSSLTRFQEKLYAGLFTGQIVGLNQSGERRQSQAGQNQLTLPVEVSGIKLTNADERLWALTSGGIYTVSNPGPESFKRFDQPVGKSPLSASHISALASDGRGRLWVGYFDRGIDVIETTAPRLILHVEDEVIREINYLHFDPDNQQMLVATSAGLVIFDQGMGRRRYTESDGLISNAVSHVLKVPSSMIQYRERERPVSKQSPHQDTLVLTTGRGLTLQTSGVFRSLTAFHGLASNHLYTGAQVNGKLYIGSLNGLNEMQGMRVIRTFQTTNSRLSHNWISALTPIGSTLYIGTYGGGVDALLPSGEWVNFASVIGKFSVNPNAMHSDGDRLYVGTLEQGVWMLEIQSERWSRFGQGLGSSNVTAITSDAQFIYFGTEHGLTKVTRARLK